MTEQTFSIYRVDRRFKTYGIRPFVLTTSIRYGSNSDTTLCAGYLILHANGELNRKIGGAERSLLKVASADHIGKFVEQAALDDAFDLLTSDIEAGGEAISSKFATLVTLPEILAARMRGAIAAPAMDEDEYLYPLSDVIGKLKSVKEFARV